MPIRICFIGDSVTLGTGDETMLSWPGRICADARRKGFNVTMYNLGVRGDTSHDIKSRWQSEVSRRVPAGVNCALVFAFGLNDCILENGVKLRVELAQSVLNAREILTRAKAWLPTLFVGPAPVDDTRLPPQLVPGLEIRVFNSQLAKLNNAFQDLTNDLGVPYLDLLTPLAAEPQWKCGEGIGDGVHPTRLGYDLMAHRVEEWESWQDLLDKSRT